MFGSLSRHSISFGYPILKCLSQQRNQGINFKVFAFFLIALRISALMVLVPEIRKWKNFNCNIRSNWLPYVSINDWSDKVLEAGKQIFTKCCTYTLYKITIYDSTPSIKSRKNRFKGCPNGLQTGFIDFEGGKCMITVIR